MAPSVDGKARSRRGLAALATVIFAGTTTFAGATAVYATEAPPVDLAVTEISETDPGDLRATELSETALGDDAGSGTLVTDAAAPVADEAPAPMGPMEEEVAEIAASSIMPMAAGEALECAGQVYVQKSPNIYLLDGVTNQLAEPAVATSQQDNGLGISRDGRYVYTVENYASRQKDRIVVLDTQTGVKELYDGPDGAPSIMNRGAVNPVTGIYYYASDSGTSGGPIWIGAMTPAGERFKVGEVVGTAGVNGDMAFTASGTLMFSAGGNIYAVDKPIPEVAGDVEVTTTLVANLSTVTDGNGLAFGNYGRVYMTTGGSVHKFDPITEVSEAFDTGAGNTDMGSCSFPNTLTVQKHIDGDRAFPGDQFTLNITGGHLNDDIRTIATTGSASGLQTERVGPEFVNQNTVYTVSEAAAGTTDLSMYDMSIGCHDYVTGTNVAATGEAPQWNIAIPTNVQGTDVVCTITNTLKQPAISLTKNITGGGTGEGETFTVGDTVEYQFDVENSGGLPLTDVTVEDLLSGLSSVTYGSWPGTAGALAPGESVTATASLTLTQAQFDAGALLNTATAKGTSPTGTVVVSGDSARADFVLDPSIKLTKTVVAGDYGVGSIVTYNFRLENNGNTTLNGVAITDAMPGLTAITYSDWPGAPNVLKPGEAANATATYALTQADVDAGGVVNTATVLGMPPDRLNANGDLVPSAPVTATDTEFLAVTAVPSIQIEKTGVLDITEASAPGDLATYTFTVTNTGTVTLTDVGISDPKLSASGADLTFGPWPGADRVLAPGESVTATSVYAITQADIDAEQVVNVATAHGTPPDVREDPNDPESEKVPADPVTDSDEEILPVNLNPVIDLVKTGVLDTSVTPTMPGTEIAYTFTITNTGNVLLKNVNVQDALPGLSSITYDWTGVANEGELAVGESITATATYALTAGDIVAGKVDNEATAYGTTPTGSSVPGG